MQLINKGKILRTFDKDAINFIDAAGLDNDVNLNVGGLYTAEQARMAVNNLVAGFKSIGVWNKLTVVYPIVGGNPEQHALNLKDPRDLDIAYRITYYDNGRGTPVHNGLGIYGRMLDTHLIHSSFYGNTNLSMGYYLTLPNTLNESHEVTSSIIDKGMSITTQHSGLYGFRGLIPYQAFLQAYKLTGGVVWSNGIMIAENKLHNINASFMPSNKTFVSGAYPIYDGNGNIIYGAGGSTGTIAFVFVGQLLTSIELQQVNYLMAIYQAQLNRKA